MKEAPQRQARTTISLDGLAQREWQARSTTIKHQLRRPELDICLKMGMSVIEMCQYSGLTGEGNRQYIIRTGQYTLWKEKREGKKRAQRRMEEEKREMKEAILAALMARIFQLQQTTSWPEKKTSEFLLSRTHTSYTQETLQKLFTLYYQAQQQGKKLSLKELSNQTGLPYQASVGRVLRAVGLEPCYGKLRRITAEPETEAALERAKEIPFSHQDIAYFLDIPDHTPAITRYFSLAKRTVRGKEIRRFQGYSLTWRKASEIYEARDARFKEKDLPQLLDTSKEVVAYALQMRKKIEPVLVKALQFIHNNNVTTPYYHKKRA